MYPEPIKRFISGNYTAEDEQYVDEWISENPEKEQELNELKAVWEKTGHFRLINDHDIDKAWQSFESLLDQRASQATPTPIQYLDQSKRGRSSSWNILFKVAAVILIGFGLFSIFKYQQAPVDEKSMVSMPDTTVRAPMGEFKELVLQDGTQIMLNAGSEVRYSKKGYGIDNRTIHLTGEAYFEVNNDGASSPFTVKTNNASIKDISTEFNIKAYRENTGTNVVVAEGRVEVAAIKDSSISTNQTVVTEGKMVNVVTHGMPLTVENADLNEALAWLDRVLIFENRSFEEVVRTLERFYAVDIVVQDETLYSKRLTASFRDETLDNVLGILAISLGATYEIDGNKISFRKENQ